MYVSVHKTAISEDGSPDCYHDFVEIFSKEIPVYNNSYFVYGVVKTYMCRKCGRIEHISERTTRAEQREQYTQVAKRIGIK